MAKHESVSVYNYSNEKLCDLYDSSVNIPGQAYNIVYKQSIDGTKTLTFVLPYQVPKPYSTEIQSRYGDAKYGAGKFAVSTKPDDNFRWDYIKGDYLVRYCSGDQTEWFVITQPTRKKAKEISGSVTCKGVESLLKTRNIYMTFDDTNGIGTVDYIMEQILKGTGWSLGHVDVLVENDGVTEKIRSLSSDGKQGAMNLITTTCNLFQCRPVFHSDTRTVDLYAMDHRTQSLELNVGHNLQSLNAAYDSSDIVTRLYVEGEYGDDGYIGIDDVNPTGLTYLLNFDYYRELGVFKEEHEEALAAYLDVITGINARIKANAALITDIEDEINTLIGQCDFALYYVSSGYLEPVYIYGDVDSEQETLAVGDEIAILRKNGDACSYRYETIDTTAADLVSTDDGDYGIIKFITKTAGMIGAKEVQVEAKNKNIANIQAKIAVTVDESKINGYNQEIEQINAEIDAIYTGDEENAGLYDLMESVMNPAGMIAAYNDLMNIHMGLLEEQDDAESDFIVAMGYMLRDGIWSNNNYALGQEQFMYNDAVTMSQQLGKPSVKYTVGYVRLAEGCDVPLDEIEMNAIVKLYDEELRVEDTMHVSAISIGVDNKSNGSVEVSNNDITLTGSDLSALLSRITQLADMVQQKSTFLDRAKSINKDGSVQTERLEGQIDVIKTRLLSSVSNWYTDPSGNIIFESADGSSAMMLSGAGFMLASGKTERGDWDWRTMGDGRGLVADEITTGFLSADRIEARSITADKIGSDVANSLDLSSNQSINMQIQNSEQNIISQLTFDDDDFTVMFDRTVSDGINSAINDVATNLDEYETSVQHYMRYGSDGILELGATESDFKTQITNQKLAFLQDSTEVAYISNQSLYITQAQINDKMTLGDVDGNGYFDFVVDDAGLGIRYRAT